MSNLQGSEPKTTWEWLYDTEQAVLLDFHPDAEARVNAAVAPEELTEERFFPFLPIGITLNEQGSNKPYLPKKHIIIAKNINRYTTIHHPEDGSFTKFGSRNGILARVRHSCNLEFQKLALAAMSENLRALNWKIYPPTYQGIKHIYLDCKLLAPDSSNRVALYVPTSYFRTKDFAVVEKCHNELAVNYYTDAGFQASKETLETWRNMTAAALTCKECAQMRSLVETQTA